MLTGELDVTSGDAFVYGHGIRTEIQKAHMNMGYCPQVRVVLILTNNKKCPSQSHFTIACCS